MKRLVARMGEGAQAPSRRARAIFPGFLVAATVAMAATFLSEHYAAPVMLFALLLGMAFNFLGDDGRCSEGIEFTARTVLRFGVGLLGARITFDEVITLGATPVLLALLGVPLTIAMGVIAARLLGFKPQFGLLTGGAVGICGASAALAIASVLPRKGPQALSESETIFTVLAVTTVSTVAMVLYPILVGALGFDDLTAGIFLGATIHDVAQVVGSGYSISPDAGDAATLTKLLRVAMLVPVVLAIGVVVARQAAPVSRGNPVAVLPVFLVAFVALVIANSMGLVPGALAVFLSDLSRWALVAAIAALGMKTHLGRVLQVGPRAMVLVLVETLWIAGLGFAVIFAARSLA